MPRAADPEMTHAGAGPLDLVLAPEPLRRLALSAGPTRAATHGVEDPPTQSMSAVNAPGKGVVAPKSRCSTTPTDARLTEMRCAPVHNEARGFAGSSIAGPDSNPLGYEASRGSARC